MAIWNYEKKNFFLYHLMFQYPCFFSQTIGNLFVSFFIYGTTAPQWAMASSFTRFLVTHNDAPQSVEHLWTSDQLTHNDAPQSVEHLWTSDQLVTVTSTWQHTQQTYIHATGGIRTHNLKSRAPADLSLRARGHRDRR